MKKEVLYGLLVAIATTMLVSCDNKETKTLLQEYKSESESYKTSQEYEYDENGNLLQMIDHYNGSEMDNSNKTMYKYDENGRLATITTYYSGKVSMKEEYEYTETGDTLSYICLNYDGEEKESVWEKKRYQYNKDGVKTHVYDCYGMVAEGEGDSHDMLTDYEYDEQGRLKEVTFYNMSSESDVYEITISSDNSTEASKEFKQLILDNPMGEPGNITYKYNEAGKLISANGKDNSGFETTDTYEYDANGNLTKRTNTPYEGANNIFTYTYNAKGQMLTEESTFGYNGTYSSNFKTTYKYDSNGDTISVVETSEYDGSTTVQRKSRYVYASPGVLKTKYIYSVSDDFGYDNQSVSKETYNDQKLKTEVHTFTMSDYREDYAISAEDEGSAEEEFNRMKEQFNMTSETTDTYKYIQIEIDHSFWAKVKSWFASSDEKEKKSSDDVDYDI